MLLLLEEMNMYMDGQRDFKKECHYVAACRYGRNPDTSRGVHTASTSRQYREHKQEATRSIDTKTPA